MTGWRRTGVPPHLLQWKNGLEVPSSSAGACFSLSLLLKRYTTKVMRLSLPSEPLRCLL